MIGIDWGKFIGSQVRLSEVLVVMKLPSLFYVFHLTQQRTIRRVCLNNNNIFWLSNFCLKILFEIDAIDTENTHLLRQSW